MTMDADATSQPPSASDTTEERTNKENIVQFWSLFKNLSHALQKRIDILLFPNADDAAAAATTCEDWNEETKNQVRTHYATATKRNEGRMELDRILKEVRLLQHRVLSSSSSSEILGKGATGNKELDELLSKQIPDLALTDVRLVSAEIDKILNHVDEAREIICPKEKFVFRRYRKALEALDQNLCDDLTNSLSGCQINSVEQGNTEDERKESQISNFGGVVENKSNCIIEVLSDGSIIHHDDTKQHEHWKGYADPWPNEQISSDISPTGTSSYLLQNLTDTTIIVHPRLQSLHIRNLENCKIHSSVLGPVHVTNCHNSEIRCTAYQLRVHDSKNVRFGVWVRSGPIIEDCTGIIFSGDFYTNDGQLGRNMYWDVKDFNWLRSLRKSPNFTVLEENKDKEINAVGVGNDVERSEVNAGEMQATGAEEDEDSEDEL